MNKDEVLRRAQNVKPNEMDEMEQDILAKGCKVGVSTGLTVCIILMLIKMMIDVPFQDVYAIYLFMLSAQWFYKYARLKRKSDLLYGFLWGGVALLLFVVYLFKIF